MDFNAQKELWPWPTGSLCTAATGRAPGAVPQQPPGEGSLTSQEEDAEGREKTREGKCHLTRTMALGAEEHSGKMTLFQSLMDAVAAQRGRKRNRQGNERRQKADQPRG